jgi:hypothetical protein
MVSIHLTFLKLTFKFVIFQTCAGLHKFSADKKYSIVVFYEDNLKETVSPDF